MSDQQSLAPGPDGWLLAPAGAIIHREARVAVIADVHLGYEWSRGHSGDIVPAHSLRETLAGLEGLTSLGCFHQLMVAGDLVESPLPCRKTEHDVAAFEQWLDSRGIRLRRVLGNHDGTRGEKAIVVAGWTIVHGHVKHRASKLITGHDHPVLSIAGVRSRCILAGPSRIILPAFTSNAAGRNVAEATLPKHWRNHDLECWAATGNRMLNFGRVDSLHERLAGAAIAGAPAVPGRSSNSGPTRSRIVLRRQGARKSSQP